MSAHLSHFETSDIQEGYREYTRRFGEFVDLAQEISNEAESYRNFDVGCVGVAILPGVSELKVISGANTKINHIAQANAGLNYEEDADELEHIGDIHMGYGVPIAPNKNCAEMEVCQEADESEEYKGKSLHFLAFIVAASTDSQEIRDITNLDTRTLPPCTECVPILLNHESTTRATQYVATGFSPNSEFEIRTARRLKELYRIGGDKFGNHTPRLSGDIGERAAEMFDSRMKNTQFMGNRPSRIFSSISRAALIEAGRR